MKDSIAMVMPWFTRVSTSHFQHIVMVHIMDYAIVLTSIEPGTLYPMNKDV
jgi:hypothetical protein